MLCATNPDQPSQKLTQGPSNNSTLPLSLAEIEQNLIGKVVPAVVYYLKETLAKAIKKQDTVTSCKQISVRPCALE